MISPGDIAGVRTTLARWMQGHWQPGDAAAAEPSMLDTLSGAACHLDAEGGAWRAYDFVEDTICLQQVGSQNFILAPGCTIPSFTSQRNLHFLRDYTSGQA